MRHQRRHELVTTKGRYGAVRRVYSPHATSGRGQGSRQPTAASRWIGGGDFLAGTTPGSGVHTVPQASGSAVTRGQFLTLSTVGLGAMIGAVIGVPATAYLLAPVTEEATFTPVALGPTSRFTSEAGFKPTAATSSKIS